MGPIDEIKNRWIRVFEQKTLEDQKTVLSKLTDEEKIHDARVLLTLVEKLEAELTDLKNPVSSSVGQAVQYHDGELSYRVEGVFIKAAVLQRIVTWFIRVFKGNKITKKLQQDGEELLTELLNRRYNVNR